jgi:hypothetical protein
MIRRPPLGPILLLVCALFSTGCVVHEARVVVPPPPPPGPDQDPPEPITVWMNARKVVVPVAVAARDGLKAPTGALGDGVTFPGDTVFRGSLPQDVRISAWRREDDGSLYRVETRATTPLRWWQRFPCDIVADLMPMDFTARTSAEVVTTPVLPMTPEALNAAACCDGYAHDDALLNSHGR